MICGLKDVAAQSKKQKETPSTVNSENEKSQTAFKKVKQIL